MRKVRFVVLALGLLIGLALVATTHAAEKYKGYERGEIFITAQELHQLMEAKDPKLVVIAVAKKTDYLKGHIPGAFQIWRPDYEADSKTTGGVTDNLMAPEGFVKLMREFGVDSDSKVVVYDHKYDATRIWWAFFYYGKPDVRILDGGFKAWSKAGYDTDMISGATAKKTGTWVAKVRCPTMCVDTQEILSLKDRTDAQLWDIRGNWEFSGKSMKKGAFRAGRVPWAVQADWVNVKKKENQAEWRTAAEVKKAVAKLGFDPNKQQYFYCQSGVRTTQWIATLYALGWPIEKLCNYDGSWIAWSKNEKLPIEKGLPDKTPAPWQKQ